jgi:hypothetical protein
MRQGRVVEDSEGRADEETNTLCWDLPGSTGTGEEGE